VNREPIRTSSLVVTALLAAFYIFNGITVALMWGADEEDRWGYVAMGLAGVSAGALMLAGTFLGGRAPWLGAGVLAAGAILMASVAYWLWPIMVPVTLVVVAFAVFRARELTRERSHGPASPAG